MREYKKCELCARCCGVDRESRVGYCGATDEPYVARAALHFWEEPVISGSRGSGTVFFSGCSLGCVYCQNREISRKMSGKPVTREQLSEIMLRLEREGAHNINLVTPTHFVPSIREAVVLARNAGLSLPIVYNTGSYDRVQTLRSLAGLVNIYLPDLKYFLPKTAREYSFAEDYPTVAREAIAEMVRQTGEPVIDTEGIMKRGVIVRILLLPAHVAEAKLSLKYLHDTYGDSVYVSLMSQYTPSASLKSPLNRKVTVAEYYELVEYAERLGVKNCFVQERSSADEAYVPEFDGIGVY